MRLSEILSHHRRQLFQPIRIYVSDGSSYEVRHPEFMYVTATTVVIGQDPEVEGVPGGAVYCDPLHITRIEPLTDGKAAPKRRGRC